MPRSLQLAILVAAMAVLGVACRSDRANPDANGPLTAEGGGDHAGDVADAPGDGPPGVPTPGPLGELTDAAPPAEITFGGEEPAMNCSDNDACLIPPPVCGQLCVEAGCQTTTWLRYLDRPRCEDGRCRFDRGYVKCDWRCDLGRCSSPPTL